MGEFKTIGIIGRESDAVGESLKVLTRFLKKRSVKVLLSEKIASLLPNTQLPICNRTQLGESCDLIIVLGGDGSLLGAARMLARHNVPVLGINRGRLGFLTDILPDELEQNVGNVLDGHYVLDKRFLLNAVVKRGAETIGRAEALNDVVVNSGTSAQMIEFDLYVDNEFVYRQRSDGLIVSTPTGSTAYSLSGGGPIMHPKLDAVVLVPMFPHTLSSRPIVIDGNSEIRIEVNGRNAIHPPVTCDGQVIITAEPGDTIFINKKRHKLKLIHPVDHSFYASCRDKLGWGSALV
ncbi:NAD(+) kinase [Oceanicoccus sp. KOV_DT_Chl]|uniref:NAD(+) kinase n=1 Tax=Oceanicoccus sp. KOV_DT_Chl TaxID=1904639 RepID=UPI000C7DCE20|nr:NAD(+) kinase [Oceanicoccus sp. KOV_DT_Chl]